MNFTRYYCWDYVLSSNEFQEPWIIIESITLVVLNFVTVTGNLMVILAVVLNRHLRAATNLFIVSLAAADMAVGFFVLPFSTATEIFGQWLFGVVWCQIWLSMDVWLCTSSIYNLLAITVDRYIAVTKPLSYRFVLTQNRAMIIIVLVWTLSFCICFPFMIASWPEAFSREIIHLNGSTPCECTQMNNSPAYIVYSALGSFYIPMTVICYFYFRIYRTVRKVANSAYDGFVPIKSRHQNPIMFTTDLVVGGDDKGSRGSEASPILTRQTSPNLYGGQLQNGAALRVHRGGYYNPASPVGSRRDNLAAHEAAIRHLRCPEYTMRRPSADSAITTYTTNSVESHHRSPSPRPRRRFNPFTQRNGSAAAEDDDVGGDNHQHQVPRLLTYGRRYQKKLSIELKALKIVGIVTGCFIACWLGFCIVYSMQALPWCENNTCVSPTTVSIVVWLGYVNSALNPFIYAACNQYYRVTFKRILRCTCFRFGQWDRDRRRQQYTVATLCRQAGACMLVVHSSQERACSTAALH